MISKGMYLIRRGICLNVQQSILHKLLNIIREILCGNQKADLLMDIPGVILSRMKCL